jgi:hypothetical protein
LAIVFVGTRRAPDCAKKSAQVDPAFKICKVIWMKHSRLPSLGGAAGFRQILLIWDSNDKYFSCTNYAPGIFLHGNIVTLCAYEEF